MIVELSSFFVVNLIVMMNVICFDNVMGSQRHQENSFEIHMLDVGQGASQLIVFPSGYTILIDVKDGPLFLTSSGGEAVVRKLDVILGVDNGARRHIDTVVVSHLDIDHIGYATRGGVWYVFNKGGYSFDRLIDRDAGVHLDGDGDGKCDDWDDKAEFEWHAVSSVTGTREKWVCWMRTLGDKRQIAQIGSTSQITPPDSNAIVKVVAADGSSYKPLLGDGLPLRADHTAYNDAPGENEYSLALKISFGRFTYATCGDIGGEDNTNLVGTRSLDIETTLAPLIGPADVFQVNHHGSSHSTNAEWLRVLSPQLALISCANTIIGHPSRSVMNRLTAANVRVVLTEKCQNWLDEFDNVFVIGDDIVVRSVDNGDTFSVVSGADGAELFALTSKGEKDMSDDGAGGGEGGAVDEDSIADARRVLCNIWCWGVLLMMR